MDRLSNPRLSLRYAIQCRPRSFSVENRSSGVVRLTRGTGAVPPYIYGDIGGADRWIWFVGGIEPPNGYHLRADPDQILANLLALAAVCPFVGSLSDLIGRRYVALSGAMFIILGMVISSTAHSMNIFICQPSSPRVFDAGWRLTERQAGWRLPGLARALMSSPRWPSPRSWRRRGNEENTSPC